ncbi:MAG: SMC family ATPase, partial [Halobacteriovoraceae bacterium]|nr:SMC family ATPase [Halobacteriovoraceae bacterium]
MRIHRLKLENIASLKGAHEINFEDIYQESNLFAITGQTGSGKSTILNCISLALYGEIYKKDSSSQDFVTLGQAQASIELTFSFESNKYRSLWQMRVKRKNGDILKKPQLIRTLFQINHETDLAIDKSVEEIIHLTFNQFCKTTILNQGEFSRFLTSKFIDRKDILEKFYEGESLDRLNIHLNKKIKDI